VFSNRWIQLRKKGMLRWFPKMSCRGLLSNATHLFTCWGSNPVPHAFSSSTLPTELSLQPPFRDFV
jgi:hypothetical protein